jgi:transposase
MDARQVRGLAIAKAKRIKKVAKDVWTVPSETHSGTYVVDSRKGTCSCPDHETRACRCKHIWAVEFVRRKVTNPDGSTLVEETLKVTYTQDWHAYNKAQTSEKAHVQILLRDLCEGIVEPKPGRGRPPLRLADTIYGATMKVFTGLSGRRADTDIRECKVKGHIDYSPHYNSIFNCLQDPGVTPILKCLVEESAAPLAAVESQFAVDGTGFATSIYDRWYDHKYGKVQKKQHWIKAHIMCGVKTHVVTAVEVTDGNFNDCPELPGLLTTTDNRFDVQEVLADKGYLSRKNVASIEQVGAVPYIPFKINSNSRGAESWKKMWHLYSFKREEFLTHYHQRSNVETVFSAIKRKFDGNVRSRLFRSQVNEVLCKVLCHNLSVLVHSFHELKIDPVFWKDPTSAT